MQLDIDAEVAKLQAMSTGELAKRYAEVFGEQARSRHKAYLIRRIAWRIQALAEGDLSERARQRAKELANDADVRVTPPQSHPVAKATGVVMPSALGGYRFDATKVMFGDGRWALRGAFERYDVGTDVDFVNVSIEYKFGWPKK